MAFSCIAIDDEPLALSLIKEFIQRIPALKLTGTFEDAIAGGEFIRNHIVDILFLDINMPDVSGIALAYSLEIRPKIIFTTAYKNYAYEGFELEAVDYLLKPYGFERFQRSVQKALQKIEEEKIILSRDTDEGIFVWSEYRQLKILYSGINYIEARDDYAYIALLEAAPVMTLARMKELVEKLPSDQFIRVHRSYIIPINMIKEVSSKKILLSSGKEIPVGSNYRDELKRVLDI